MTTTNKATSKQAKAGIKIPRPHPTADSRPDYFEFHPDILKGMVGTMRIDRTTAVDPALRTDDVVELDGE